MPEVLIMADPVGYFLERSGIERVDALPAIAAQPHEPDVAQYAKRKVVLKDGLIVTDTPVEGRTLAAQAVEP